MSADPGSGRRRGLKRRRLLQAGFAATAFGATGAGAAEDETAAAPEGFFQAHGRDPRIAVSESGRALLEVVKRFWERINGTVVATGSSNAYVYTTADKALPLAYAQGEAYSFKAGFSNTGGASLNVNGLGFKPLYKQSVDGPSELASGEIRRGQFLTVMYELGPRGWRRRVPDRLADIGHHDQPLLRHDRGAQVRPGRAGAGELCRPRRRL